MAADATGPALLLPQAAATSDEGGVKGKSAGVALASMAAATPTRPICAPHMPSSS